MDQNKVMRENLSIQLPDGRRLGYAEYGLQSGQPVLFFHGTPGSSYIHTDMAATAKQCGIRLIAVDRPGYGLSTPQSGRLALGWADDVVFLMEALAISKFSIIGFSLGCMYALACAYSLAERVTKVMLASPLAPVGEPNMAECLPASLRGLYVLAQSNPVELRKTFSAIAPSAEALLTALPSFVGEWDKPVLLNRAYEFLADYTRALRSGIDGVASDYELAYDWGFSLREIKTQIKILSGTSDQNAPLAMSQYLASQLPNCHLDILQGEGHYALYGHWDEILNEVA